MVFYCQRNCYVKEYETQVVSCEASKLEVIENGKKKKINCYQVIFQDTVFFPEGGGQPDDRGTVNNIPVMRVLREGGNAIHYMKQPLHEGEKVTQVISWARRHDHMQQHTSQHLITAMADSLFSMATVSWYLGDVISHIEMKTDAITTDQILQIEQIVNEKIRASTPVTITEYDAQDPLLKEVRTRGLPDDVVGPVRVVSIEDVDVNMCCGTHVSNLAHLQVIKLLHTEKGKCGNTLLFFIAGNRVLSYMNECYLRERSFNVLLHSCPADHLRLVEKTQKDLKVSLHQLKNALKDLANEEAKKFLFLNPRPLVFYHHRKDGDLEYLGAIINAIDDKSILKILTSGEDSGPGVLVVDGPPELVKDIAPKLCEILEGKGGGKTRFTAKVTKLGKIKEAISFVNKYMNIQD